MKKINITKKRIAITIIVLVILAVPIHYYYAKNRLSSEYEKIQKPASVRLTNVNYIGIPSDTGIYWGYLYASANPKKSVEEFKQNITNDSGYEISGRFGGYIATKKSKNIKITVRELKDGVEVMVFPASGTGNTP